MNDQTQQPTLVRWIGKVKERLCNGKSGQFTKHTIWIDNPNPVNEDGTPNKYHKGALLWCDAETGEKYLVKQIELAGVSDDAKGKGFINSLKLDLASTYNVDKLG